MPLINSHYELSDGGVVIRIMQNNRGHWLCFAYFRSTTTDSLKPMHVCLNRTSRDSIEAAVDDLLTNCFACDCPECACLRRCVRNLAGGPHADLA